MKTNEQVELITHKRGHKHEQELDELFKEVSSTSNSGFLVRKQTCSRPTPGAQVKAHKTAETRVGRGEVPLLNKFSYSSQICDLLL